MLSRKGAPRLTSCDWSAPEGLGTRSCRALADRMQPCWLPFEDITFVAFLVLGASWSMAVDGLARILIEADPANEEVVGRLRHAYTGYCQRIVRRSTPAAFRERADVCRRATDLVARRMSVLLGRSFSAFESSNPSLAFPIRASSRLEAMPYAVGIAEAERP